MGATKIVYSSKRQIETCPNCNGTGLELDDARQLWERKVNITQNELIWLIAKKLNTNTFLTDYKTNVNFQITQSDLYQIIKQRGLWIPCRHCMGRGVVHKIIKGVEII